MNVSLQADYEDGFLKITVDGDVLEAKPPAEIVLLEPGTIDAHGSITIGDKQYIGWNTGNVVVLLGGTDE